MLANSFHYIRKNFVLFVVLLLAIIAKINVMDTCFFWDSISVISRPSSYLFENGLFQSHYPTNLGFTIPMIPDFYTAVAWKIGGRSLATTHLAFLPILLLFIIQTYRLCKKTISEQYIPFAFILLLADPAVTTQSLLIFADIFLLLFFVSAVYYALCDKKTAFSLSILLLSTTSERGILIGIALMLCFFICKWKYSGWKTAVAQAISIYIPSFIFVCYLLYQQQTVGEYLILNLSEDSPWQEHWHRASLKTMFRNILIFCFQFIGENRLFLCIGIIAFILKNKKRFFYENKRLILLFGCLLLISIAMTIPFNNPFGRRYFMPLFIIISLILSRNISQNVHINFRKPIFIILIITSITGHLYVHPEKRSQSWDCTLAHFPYYELHREAIQWLNDNNINYNDVGVGFPMTAPDLTDLNGEKRIFSSIDSDKNEWVLYSNIFNLDDNTIDSIKQLQLVKTFEKRNIFIKIYKNKKSTASYSTYYNKE